MKKNLPVIAILVISSFYMLKAHAQPAIQWQKTIGGTMGDQLLSIEQTIDGGYIACGSSASNISGDKTENSIGSSDYWVVKLDGNGNIQWQNTIGGDNSDEAKVIHQTADGGYILGGSSLSGSSGDKTEASNGTYDFWILKLDALGNILWQNGIGGDEYDYLASIFQTNDGGYIAAGYSYSNVSGDKSESAVGFLDYWVVKLSSTGAVQWDNTIGGTQNDELHAIAVTSDNGYILGGYSNSGMSGDKNENSIGAMDYWILKLDSTGSIQWQNTIGGTGFEWLSDVQQINNGDYIVAGYSESPISGDKTEDTLGGADFWIMQLNSSGNIVWQNVIGGNALDYPNSIRQTSDNGFIIGGWSRSDSSADKSENNWDPSLFTADYWIVKIDPLGNIQWENTIGGEYYDHLAFANETSDGGYILGGTSISDSTGDKTQDSYDASPDYWIIKLYPDSTTSINETSTNKNIISVFPNPATNEIKIQHSDLTIESVEIYNSFGQLVYSVKQGQGKISEKINVSSLRFGIYFVRVNAGEQITTTKFIKE